MPQERYYALAAAQRRALTAEQFIDSVKMEAVERGIKLPITLSSAINQLGFPGFHLPPDAMIVHEIISPEQYGNKRHTGVAFKTPEQAWKALEGALCVKEDGYGSTRKFVIGDPADFAVQQTPLVFQAGTSVAFKLKEFQQETEDYDKLLEECRADLEQLRQQEYDRRVTQQKRAEYLRLAGGDETIAAAFWQKTEGTPFPPQTETETQ